MIKLDEKLEDILFIKNFLKIFDVYYEKIPYESMLDIKYKGKTNLYQGNINVGTLSYNDGKYIINISLDDFNLYAESLIDKSNNRRFFTLEYKLIKENNKINGIYKVNSCDDRYNKKSKKKIVVKHKLKIYNGDVNTNYYRFYTIKNEVYLNDLKTNEYINFNNDSISHKLNKSFTNIEYDNNDKILNYLYSYYSKENEPLLLAGGYKLFEDNNKEDLSDIRKNYRLKMDELDPLYTNFIKLQKDTLNYFYDDLFKRIVDNSLTTLTNKEKEYIFDIKKDDCYKIKTKNAQNI